MKKSIAFLGLLFLFIGVQAQTKEETEKWIVEKINKYATVKQSRTLFRGIPDYEPMYTNTVKYSTTGYTWYWEYRDYMPIQFSIREGIIEQTYNYKVQEKPYNENTFKAFKTHNKPAETKNENITIKASIHNIDTVLSYIQVCYPSGRQYWEEDCKGYTQLLAIKLKCPCGILVNSNGNAEKTDYLFLLIVGNEEPDLINRMGNALGRLKTFYPAPKEVF